MTSGNEMTRTTSRPVAKRAGSAAPRSASTRWSRRRSVLAVFAGVAVVGFAAAYIGPMGSSLTRAQAEELPVSLYADSLIDAQQYVSGAEAAAQTTLDRGSYSVYVTPKPTPTPTPEPTSSRSTWTPAFVTPDPGSAQAVAYDMVAARGWGEDQFSCLVALWNKESGWRVNAYNASSGAYGIPQSLPGSKMASAGADWQTNPATQISWGLGYISGRYGTPCGAWGHSQRTGWY